MIRQFTPIDADADRAVDEDSVLLEETTCLRRKTDCQKRVDEIWGERKHLKELEERLARMENMGRKGVELLFESGELCPQITDHDEYVAKALENLKNLSTNTQKVAKSYLLHLKGLLFTFRNVCADFEQSTSSGERREIIRDGAFLTRALHEEAKGVSDSLNEQWKLSKQARQRLKPPKGRLGEKKSISKPEQEAPEQFSPKETGPKSPGRWKPTEPKVPSSIAI